MAIETLRGKSLVSDDERRPTATICSGGKRLSRQRLSKIETRGGSRGFGFVEMASKEEGEKAIEQFNGTDMNGRNLTVNEAPDLEKIVAIVAAAAVVMAAAPTAAAVDVAVMVAAEADATILLAGRRFVNSKW